MKRSLTIPGNPTAKGRPRCGHGKVYTPVATMAAEEQIGYAWKEKYGQNPWSTPVRVFLTFLEGPGQRAQDADNLAKLVLDALNHLAWKDDRQVLALHVELFRNRAEGQTRIIVEEMDGTQDAG
jgi:Holliday junction resolvase